MRKILRVTCEFEFEVPADYEVTGEEYLSLGEDAVIDVVNYKDEPIETIGIPEFTTTEVVLEDFDAPEVI